MSLYFTVDLSLKGQANKALENAQTLCSNIGELEVESPLVIAVGKNFEVNADLFIDVLDHRCIKIGFNDPVKTSQTQDPSNLHWVTVSNYKTEKDLLENFLLLLLGMVKIKSAWGTNMTDLVDFKASLRLGNIAVFMTVEDAIKHCQVLQRPLRSFLVLMNSLSSSTEKMNLASALSQMDGEMDSPLGIMNLTETPLIRRENVGLFIW